MDPLGRPRAHGISDARLCISFSTMKWEDDVLKHEFCAINLQSSCQHKNYSSSNYVAKSDFLSHFHFNISNEIELIPEALP